MLHPYPLDSKVWTRLVRAQGCLSLDEKSCSQGYWKSLKMTSIFSKKTQGSTQKKTESDAIIRIPSQSKQPDPDVECDNELLDGFQHFLVSKLRN